MTIRRMARILRGTRDVAVGWTGLEFGYPTFCQKVDEESGKVRLRPFKVHQNTQFQIGNSFWGYSPFRTPIVVVRADLCPSPIARGYLSLNTTYLPPDFLNLDTLLKRQDHHTMHGCGLRQKKLIHWLFTEIGWWHFSLNNGGERIHPISPATRLDPQSEIWKNSDG